MLTLPTVSGTTPSFATSGSLAASTTSLQISFSQPVLGGGDAANYELRSLGADGLLGTADDTIVTVTPIYSGTTAKLNFAALTESVYRRTVRDAITDASLNILDGDADGASGGDWVRDFVVLPSASDLFYTTSTYSSGGSRPESVAIGDTNGDGRADLAVGYGYSATVEVLLGQAGGGFPGETTYASGGRHVLLGRWISQLGGDRGVLIAPAAQWEQDLGP
jgi:hypothetical protein